MAESQRDLLLRGAAAYTLEHGFARLSLRPLGKALGTSDRMLLYHFGSKEGLIRDVMHHLGGQLADLFVAPSGTVRDLATIVRVLWGVLVGEQAAPFVRAYVELFALALHEPRLYGEAVKDLTDSWTAFLAGALDATLVAPGARLTAATLILATLDGLFIYRQASGDHAAADGALERFAAGVDQLFSH